MSIIFFIFLFFIIAALCGLPLYYWHKHIKLKYLIKITQINILRQQQYINVPVFFSSDILKRICTILCNSAASRQCLEEILTGKPQKAINLLQKKDAYLSVLLTAHFNALKAFNQAKRQQKLWINHKKYGIFLPMLAYLTHNNMYFFKTINKLPPERWKRNGYFQYLFGYAYLYEGDMLSASQSSSNALKFFQKKHDAIETAECYIQTAEIYRLSCINDIAHTMLDAAEKIYKQIKLPYFSAKILILKGMLDVFENNFDTALQKYQKAEQTATSKQQFYDIINQKTLVYIIKHNFTQADKELKNAFAALEFSYSYALTLQLAALNSFYRQKYRKCIKLAQQSAALYHKQNNHSAYVEVQYLCAQAYLQLNKTKNAENILRDLLSYTAKQHTNFHRAHIYSTLGLIYIQKQEYQRAKVLFQQSLALEQSNQRCEGMVADYVNLALLENKFGDTEKAQNNLIIAAEYAEKSGDKDLLQIIEQQLTALK